MVSRALRTHLNPRVLISLVISILPTVFVACNDQSRPTNPAIGEKPVANALNRAVDRRLTPIPLRSIQPGTPGFSAATAAVTARCASILVYDNNSRFGLARLAIQGMGLGFTVATSTDFDATLTAQTWDLVVMDLPSNEPDGDWQTSLASHIRRGGRAIHTHWNAVSLTSALQAAFEISNPVEHQTQSFYQWNASTLFTSPYSVPASFDVWSDTLWSINGIAVTPTGTAVAAAGFAATPSGQSVAIVVGNSGRTVFNGFLFDDFDSADKNADGQKDIEQLIQNEVAQVCGAGSGATQVIPAGEAATITVSEGGKPVAGIDIPQGTFPVDVTVTVQFVAATQSAPCHAYLLGQIGRCLQITALTTGGHRAINQQPMTAGLCLSEELGPRELFKFEDRQGTPAALRQTDAPFLDCMGFQVGSAARVGGLKGLAMGVARSVGRWLSPTPLYAAHGGFGGKILAGDGLSFFTWASPLPISNAGLAVNVGRSGRDAYALNGTFKLQPAPTDPFPTLSGFSPATDAVTVSFATNSYTIPGGSFKYSPLVRRWLYAAQTGTGITAMSMDLPTGRFVVAATVPTGGNLPVDKPFSIRIGNHTQGMLIVCAATGGCKPQEPSQ